MNFTTISQSEINNPSAAFIFGEVAANPKVLGEKASIDIVKGLFGIRAVDPTAIDITEALVKNLSVVESNTIRSMLQDRGVSGLIWRFTTSKNFMIELEKIPTAGNHHSLNMTLVYVNKDSNIPSTYKRQLVRFDKNGVTFFDKHMTEVDYSSRNFSILTQLHDEAVSKLSDKYLKPVDKSEPPAPKIEKHVLEKNKVYTFEVNSNTIRVLNTLTGVEMFEFDSADHVQELKAHGPTIMYNEVTVAIGQDDPANIISTINAAIENPEVVEHGPETPPTTPHDQEPETKIEPSANKLTHEVLHPQPPPKEEEVVQTPSEPEVSSGEPRPGPVVDEPLPAVPVEKKVFIVVKAGSTVTFIRTNPDMLDFMTMLTPDCEDGKVEMVDPNFADPTFKLGQYRAKEDVTSENLEFEQVSDFMEHFELEMEILPAGSDIKFNPNPPSIKVAKEVTDNGEPTETQSQPKEEPKEMNAIKVVIDPSLKSIEDTLTSMLVQAITNNPGATDQEITDTIKACTEIDEIRCEYKDDAWHILPDVPAPTEPEEPTIDLTNINNQLNMLKGLFGVTDPAITHVEKFLRNHLTEEGNAGFLKTGTFPTETTIVYTQKPYDVTICILKFKDGRFYRIMWAKTDMSLGEAANHGYLSTSDIQGRWIRLGRDIQNNVFRPEQRRRY